MTKRGLIVSFLVGWAVFVVATLILQIQSLPSFERLKKNYKTQDYVLLDRNERIIHEIQQEKIHRLEWVKLEEVSEHFLAMTVFAKGATTITMQVADYLFEPKKLKRLDRILKSVALEMAWTEKQILEAYLNLSGFKLWTQGLSAASFRLFDKPARNLNRVESAILVARLHAPDGEAADIRSHACELLTEQESAFECALVTEEEIIRLDERLGSRTMSRLASHAIHGLILEQSEGQNAPVLRSTLDRDLQWLALRALQREKTDGAVVLIENKTGHVLIYVSQPEGEIITRREVGSSLKPLLYTKAFDERVLTARSELSDSAIAGNNLVTVRQAIQEGLHLPALQALERLGIDEFVFTLNRLGFSGLRKPEAYSSSLALGAAEVGLLELVNAYRTIANRGEWSEAKLAPNALSQEAARRVFSADASYLISNIMKVEGPLPRSANFDLEGQFRLGFTQKYTLGVWTRVAGKAAPLWEEILAYVHRQEPSLEPTAPPSLAQSQGEWFIAGTEPDVKALSFIVYPQDKAVIPVGRKGRQKPFYIQIQAPHESLNLYVNGERLGRAAALIPFHVEEGLYVLELRSPYGETLQKVEFELRDALNTPKKIAAKR